jgi:hypothetical protein
MALETAQIDNLPTKTQVLIIAPVRPAFSLRANSSVTA